MTLRMYADRKKLPLDRVTVEVSHGKVHADDCAECADNDNVFAESAAHGVRNLVTAPALLSPIE